MMLAEELRKPGAGMPQGAAGALEQELDCLPGEQVLFRSAGFQVVCAKADQIPNLLFEIGRLRQMSLALQRPDVRREVDLDRFDLYYTHLLLCDNQAKKIAGACRIGHVDRILKRFGKEGLYTGSLFRLKDRFLKQVETGLEISKFFLREEYRGLSIPLPALLHGIGSEAGRDPRRTIFFGPVTIDESSSGLLKQMMFAYPANHYHAIEFTASIRCGRQPRRGSPQKATCGISSVLPSAGRQRPAPIADAEADRGGIPAVLKHCLKLGGKIVTFDPVSPAGNSFQGLIMVDLLRCDHRLLRRCMGRQAYSEFITCRREDSRGPAR